ncbi:MAG: YqeG family HAD IIIA-type phosphatase [Clostridiales bacterium]|nr:YqeG family HAD IIIA-type phosphatase [Clostridiales bacterium]
MLLPDLLKNRITDITASDLRALGVKGLLLDVDNTLALHGSQVLDPAVEEWLQRMKEEGIALTVVSNAFPRRVAPFAGRIGLEYVAFSCKPLPFGYRRGIKRLGLSRKECAIVGDQTFTDVLGGKLCGVHTIQLYPIRRERDPIARLKRRLEGRILKDYERRHSEQPPER